MPHGVALHVQEEDYLAAVGEVPYVHHQPLGFGRGFVVDVFHRVGGGVLSYAPERERVGVYWAAGSHLTVHLGA